VSGASLRDAMSSRMICERYALPSRVSGTRVKRIEAPSGDQEMGEAGGEGGYAVAKLHVPDVSRWAFVPARDTSHRCDGGA